MTYNLTLILRDERGTTKVHLIDVDEERLRTSPLLAALVEMHEHSLAPVAMSETQPH